MHVCVVLRCVCIYVYTGFYALRLVSVCRVKVGMRVSVHVSVLVSVHVSECD